ncbi:O-antigen/teichoic acid export membrane protein [Roseinatronobacter thiooxidans]|uniref:O-antigen/teichoic acid export membrane protein n=1 Tax=Roseinatronobacter thiooxidans TaxID=121821 RepID=A0A2W7QC59_9RHOB|nr:oligosaccharide flippase family protein [Roseinatronobacter thiooxidans]PZX45753.1 O-antigen/teichoic acid export membrane protein [Roseinatronobacter thiooxidans]
MTTRKISTIVSIVAMLVFSIFQRTLGLVSFAVLSRILTPAEVGIYAFTQSTGQSFVGVLRLGAIQGLHVMIARRMGAERPAPDLGELLGGGVILCSAIALSGTALMLLLADPIATYVFGEPELAPYVIIGAIFFVGQFLSRAVYAGFAGMGRFVEYTYCATVVGFATVAATILGTLLFGVQGAVWGFAGATLAGVPVFIYGLLRALRMAAVRIRFRPQRDHIRQIFVIGLPFYAAGVFLIPAEYLSQGLVSRSGGIEELADLRVILTLMAVVQLIPQAISGPIISLFSEREGQKVGSGATSAFEHMRWLWIFALASGAALAAIWPLAVTLLFGTGFPQVVAMGQMAIVAFIPTIAGTSLSAGILVGGRTLPLVFVGGVQAAVMISLAVLLIEPLGLAGFFLAQAGAASCAVILWLAVLGWQTQQKPIRPWMMPLMVATVALWVMLALDAVTAEPLWLRLVAGLLGVPALVTALLVTAVSPVERQTFYECARNAVTRGTAALSKRWGRSDKE